MELIYIFFGVLLGAAIGFLFAKLLSARKASNSIDPQTLKEQYVLRDLHLSAQARVQELELKAAQNNEVLLDLNKAIAAQEQMIDQLREQQFLEEKEHEKRKHLMHVEFENLASSLLEEKSKRFTQQNHENLNNVLSPFSERLRELERKLEHYYTDENKQKATLSEQIKQLTDLNRLMASEAQNLTKALKGDSKVQGNWGELILERILEHSGLQKDREYKVQNTYYNEDGRRRQPDLVVYLPQNRQIIIDSKVSLTAYERFCSANTAAEQEKWIKEHMLSLSRHIEELSLKSYQQLYGLNSLDFVLLFIPIEPAFTLAMQADTELFYKALEKNIMLVGPSTLLITLRTISNLWRQEQQNQNALEIARQGGLLYDKFVSWVEELDLLGQRMQTAQNSYQLIMNRLSTGRGNLIHRAEQLKSLGVKASKTLPEQYLQEYDADGMEL